MVRNLLLQFVVILLTAPSAISQTNISGIINTYIPVINISSTCDNPCAPIQCISTITVTSAAGFATGDRVILIQMKGAVADTTNSVNHGNIIAINDAGNYEFGTIASVSGNNITTVSPLKNTYFTGITPKDSACVQLIKVPKYQGNVNVTGTLTAQNWNGRTGGVLAFEATGTVTLNGNINLDGKGFKGARSLGSSISCGVDTAFYYQSSGLSSSYSYYESRFTNNGCNQGCISSEMHNTNDARQSGYRGEGIVANTFKRIYAGNVTAVFDKGRGRWGNGGGGGGNHNAGGGGGGNYGTGGFGGNAFNQNGGCNNATLTNRKGYGGFGLGTSDIKLFLGGGGGEGHANVSGFSQGTNGGGIIFIKATELINNGNFSISANGLDNSVVTGNDGMGGGGAGGSIILSISSYTNNTNISAKGGKGGDFNNNTCHGTGGGGAGGVIKFSNNIIPTAVSVNVSGGVNGTQLSATINCGTDRNWGATPGSNGLAVALNMQNNGFFNENICNGTFLPVKIESFTADNIGFQVLLKWMTTEEVNNSKFNIERSIDGKTFETIGSKNAKRAEGSSYSFIDYALPKSNIVYYRLKQIDLNGQYEYYGPLPVSLKQQNSELIMVAPNPVSPGNPIEVRYFSASSEKAGVTIYNLFGQIVYTSEVGFEKGYNNFKIETSAIESGNYLLKITQAASTVAHKIIIH